MMYSFLGLGNPGNNYAQTKHNAGFWVLDELSKRWKIDFKPGDGDYVYAEKNGSDVVLIKPTTGMNSCLLYTSPSPRDQCLSRMPSSA